MLRGGLGWGDPHRAPTLPSGGPAATCTRMLMVSVGSTVRFLVPTFRSRGCTPGRWASTVMAGGGARLIPPTHTARAPLVTLTVSRADPRAQPAPAPLAPQVGGQVEAAGGPAVLGQREAGTQVGSAGTQTCVTPGQQSRPRCPQPCSCTPQRDASCITHPARGVGTGFPPGPGKASAVTYRHSSVSPKPLSSFSRSPPPSSGDAAGWSIITHGCRATSTSRGGGDAQAGSPPHLLPKITLETPPIHGPLTRAGGEAIPELPAAHPEAPARRPQVHHVHRLLPPRRAEGLRPPQPPLQPLLQP